MWPRTGDVGSCGKWIRSSNNHNCDENSFFLTSASAFCFTVWTLSSKFYMNCMCLSQCTNTSCVAPPSRPVIIFISVKYSYIVYIIVLLFLALLIINKTTNLLTFVSFHPASGTVRRAKAGLFLDFWRLLNTAPSAASQIPLFGGCWDRTLHCKKSRRTFRCPFEEYLPDTE